MRERSFLIALRGDHRLQKPRSLLLKAQAPPFGEEQRLPDRDGRKPELVSNRCKRTRDTPSELSIRGETPDPDVRVEKQLHFRSASHASSGRTGETMSHRISICPLYAPRTRRFPAASSGGTTRATGLPKRVTVTGRLVRRTSSRTARQVALKREIARVGSADMPESYHGLLPWSNSCS